MIVDEIGTVTMNEGAEGQTIFETVDEKIKINHSITEIVQDDTKYNRVGDNDVILCT